MQTLVSKQMVVYVMKNTRIFDKILLIASALVLGGGGLALTLFPAPRYSQSENRYLQTLPTLQLRSFSDGSWSAAMDTYAAERVPFRTPLRHLQGISTLALGARESHGVILCRDGSLTRRLPINEAAFSQNLTTLSRLPALVGGLSLTVAVAPRRIDVRSEVLPTLYDTARERAAWASLPAQAITFLDCTEDRCWFRTDHHWTADGAYFAYVRLGDSLNYTPLPAAHFSPQCVSRSFWGTSASAAGIPGITPDTLSLWRAENDGAFRVFRNGEAAEFKGLYDIRKLQDGDPYSTFLGGNCGVLEIDQGDADTRPVLLVIHDSFACALLPFLAQHYRILAIDPRYHQGGLADARERADLALCICGLQTLTDAPFFTSFMRTNKRSPV